VDGNRKVLIAGLAGNLLVAVTKFVAASITHSVAMMSEAVHSTVDTSNELLLLYGSHRAEKAPTTEHPLGYGREFYFWSFVVALLIFVAGAGVSI
jgi:divalent metal cation (Fe/Co/Zn/Cd) transporter